MDLLPVPTDDPDADWTTFARGYTALVSKHPGWAAKARPDWAILRAMLSTLNDEHATFMTPDDVRHMTETSLIGIGVRLVRPQADRPPHVAEVFRESPAASAGVRPGDQVVAVDGTPTEGRGLAEIESGISGAPGTPVTISVVRGGQPPVDVRITRALVEDARVEASVRSGILGVLRIRRFGEGVPELVQQYLTQGQNRGARAWILDLRGNAERPIDDGAIEAMALVATNFIEARPVGLAVDRSGQPEPIAAPGRPAIPRFPFVVLVDAETASGAELLTAAIKEHRIAPIVGVRTAGNVALAPPRSLSDGSAIQVTIGRLLSPSGAPIDKHGVQPDVEATLTVDDLQRGDDPQLMRAFEVLAGTLPAPPAQAPR